MESTLSVERRASSPVVLREASKLWGESERARRDEIGARRKDLNREGPEGDAKDAKKINSEFLCDPCAIFAMRFLRELRAHFANFTVKGFAYSTGLRPVF
jgi:hypothetical protein